MKFIPVFGILGTQCLVNADSICRKTLRIKKIDPRLPSRAGRDFNIASPEIQVTAAQVKQKSVYFSADSASLIWLLQVKTNIIEQLRNKGVHLKIDACSRHSERYFGINIQSQYSQQNKITIKTLAVKSSFDNPQWFDKGLLLSLRTLLTNVMQ